MCRAKTEYLDDGAPKTPFSRAYLCPHTDQVINCAMGLRYPIEVDALKKAFSDSVLIQHPRFSSLMVRNHVGKRWTKAQVNLDDHFVIVEHPNPTNMDEGYSEDDVEASLNSYLADLAVASPLSENKPLWEVHVLMVLNCIVLRVHHALGDGDSLMSMLVACFGRRDGVDKERERSSVLRKPEPKKKPREGGVWGLVKTVWFTVVFVVKGLGMFFWVKDEKSEIYGGKGVELLPRTLKTLKFDLQDFKFIKQAIPNATINDVLLGVLSNGLSKYLLHRKPATAVHGLRFTALQPVNLRKVPFIQEVTDLMERDSFRESSSWGNKTGMQVLPMKCRDGLRPLEHVKRMKAIMDQRKQSYEAYFLYLLLKFFISCLGPMVAGWLGYRLMSNATLLISNMVGPTEEIAISSNPVTYIRVNISSRAPALIVYLVSYAGKADLQVMVVAEDVISDPQFLAKCFQESLIEMKVAANSELSDDKELVVLEKL